MRYIPLRKASMTSPSSSIFSSLPSAIPVLLGEIPPAPEGAGGMSILVLRDRGHVRRFGALRALAGLELDLRAFGESLEAVARDLRMVDEQILAAVLRCDEPVPLRVTEPFHGSGCHRKNTSLTELTNGYGKCGGVWARP